MATKQEKVDLDIAERKASGCKNNILDKKANLKQEW